MKIADDQIKDFVDFFKGDKNERKAEDTTTEIPQIPEDSDFLKFMKRVDKEFHEAQGFLYNVTDNFIPLPPLTTSTQSTTKVTQSTTFVTRLSVTSGVNNNNRLAPIPISDPPAPAPVAPAKQDDSGL